MSDETSSLSNGRGFLSDGGSSLSAGNCSLSKWEYTAPN